MAGALNGCPDGGRPSIILWTAQSVPSRRSGEPSGCKPLETIGRIRARKLPGGEKLFVLPVERLDRVLNHVDLVALEQWFAALRADPGRDGIPIEVVAAAIDAERSGSLHQATLAVKAVHQGFPLTRSRIPVS